MQKNIYYSIIGLSFILVWYATYYFLLPGETISYRYIVYGLLTPILLHYTNAKIQVGKRTTNIIALFFATLMSLGLTACFSIARTHNLELCTGSTRACLIWILKLLIYTYIIYNLALYTITKVEIQSSKSCSLQSHPFSNKKLFLIFFTSKIPYLILFYPCSWQWDDVTSLNMFTPSHILFDWHPFLICVIQRLFYDFGSFIGHPSLGLATFTLSLFVVSSLIMVYAIRIVGKLGCSVKTQTILIIVFSLFPLFPLISMKISKDGIFSYAILTYILTLLDIQICHRHNKPINNKLLLANGIAALLMCFSRHQGIYFIFVQFVIMAIVYKESIKKWCLIYIPIILLYYTTINIIYPRNNIAPTSKGEMYGSLFQQSAFCFIHDSQKITPQEKSAFLNIIDINPDTIEKCFSYTTTDNIKFKYRYLPTTDIPYNKTRHYFSEEEESKALNNYLKSYITTFKNNPYDCFLAEMNIIYPFFYNNFDGLWIFYNWKNCPHLIPESDYYANISLYDIGNRTFKKLSSIPITEFVFSWCYYSWIFILCFVILLYKRGIYGLTSFTPVLLSLLTLFICPMAYFRYYLPLIVVFPLLIAYIISPQCHKSITKK